MKIDLFLDIRVIRRKEGLPDIFNDHAIVLFSSTAENSKGMIKKVTPNIQEVLGYAIQETHNMSINQLMPAPFAERHDEFIKKFLEKGTYTRMNRSFHLYVVDRERFLHPMEMYLRLESVQNELMIGSYIKVKNTRTCIIMLDGLGNIVNYDTKLHKALGYSLKSEKHLYGANICSFMPFLIPYYLNFPEESLTELFHSSDNEAVVEEGANSILTMQRGYICIPKKEATITFMKGKSKNLIDAGGMTGKNHLIEGMFLKALTTAYQEFTPNDVDLFAIKFNYKKNMERDDIIKVTVIEMEEMRRVNNEALTQDTLAKTAEFIKKLHSYFRELKGFGSGEAFHHAFTREETVTSEKMINEAITAAPRTVRDDRAIKGQKLKLLSKYLLGIDVMAKDEDLGRNLENDQNGAHSPVHLLVRTPKEAMVAALDAINENLHERLLQFKRASSIKGSMSSFEENILSSCKGETSDELSSSKIDPSTTSDPKFKTIPQQKDDFKNLDHKISKQMSSLTQSKLEKMPGKRVVFERTLINEEDSQSPSHTKARIRPGFTLKVTPSPNIIDDDDDDNNNNEYMPLSKLKTFPQSVSNNRFLQPPTGESLNQAYENRIQEYMSPEKNEKKIRNALIQGASLEDQDLLAKQAISGSENVAEWNSGRKYRRHLIKREKSSENTSLISNNHRYLTKILHERSFNKHLIPINNYGRFMALTLLAFLLTIFLLYIPALLSVHEFVDHADFTNKLMAGYSIFAARLELSIMINENMFTLPSAKTIIEEETKDLLHIGYELFKETYTDSLINEDVHRFSKEVELRDFTFNVLGLGVSGVPEYTTLNFTHANSRILHLMQEVMANPTANFIRDHEIVQYFRDNFVEYFTKMTEIATTLHEEIETRGPQDRLKHTLQILMILILVLLAIYALIMIPIFRYVERLQEHGLSKMTTVPNKELEKKILLFQKARSYLEGNLKLSSAVKATASKSGLTSGSKIMKQDEIKAQANRVFRSWKKEQARFGIVFSVILLAFSPLIIYFAVVCEQIIVHLGHFKPVMLEWDIVIDAHCYFNTYYYIAYNIINDWAEDPTEQGKLLKEHKEILETIKENAQDLVEFLSKDLEQQLHLGESFTEEYKSRAPLFVSHDVCLLLERSLLRGQTIEECQNILKGVARLGLPTMLSKVYEELDNILIGMEQNNFALSKAQGLVNEEEFVELDGIMIYGDEILTEYNRLVRENLLHILTSQNTEIFIEMAIGISIIVVLYGVFWRYFIRKLDDAMHEVKLTMSVLPFDVLMHNSYMTKYLRDNSSLVNT